MLKLRLVALFTIVAIVGLLFSLTAIRRHQNRQPSKPAPSSQQVEAQESAPLQPSAVPSAVTNTSALAAPILSNGMRDYSVLPDGRPVPELPATAPKSCGFGAILFTFEGVQLAPRNPRGKGEALQLAKALLPEAELDFAQAAKKGDPGSMADAGSITRGVLERSVEYQLFTLEKGKVYPEPIETPRGFWILRRTR
jgi:hypothetical protein